MYYYSVKHRKQQKLKLFLVFLFVTFFISSDLLGYAYTKNIRAYITDVVSLLNYRITGVGQKVNVQNPNSDRNQKVINLEEEIISLQAELNAKAVAISSFDYIMIENERLRKQLRLESFDNRIIFTGQVISLPTVNDRTKVAKILGGKDRLSAVGYVASGKNGLIGRVSSVGNNTSSILLINDTNSHIPVIVGDVSIRGILKGNGDGPLNVISILGKPDLKVGDIVFTDTFKTLIPKGIPVGKVVKILEDIDLIKLEVESFENMSELDFITIVGGENIE